MIRYRVAVGEVVGSVAALVHSGARVLGLIADDLRGVDASPENGIGGSPEKGTGEPPNMVDGPDSYIDYSPDDQSQLLHATAHRARWRPEDELEDRAPRSPKRIGFTS